MIVFVPDGYSAPLVFHLCAALLKGSVIHRPGVCGRSFTAGTYVFADGRHAHALLSWPHGDELVIGDAYDVATALVAQLAAEAAQALLRELVGECPTERLLPVAATVEA